MTSARLVWVGLTVGCGASLANVAGWGGHGDLGDRDYAYTGFGYEGTKVGLFNHTRSDGSSGGAAGFDFFRQDHDGGPKRPR